MANKEIAESVHLNGIKHTGFALRDWLGPYYMLGGAVAFGIAMLTVLDPSGQLVRAVGALLLALTILAWGYHFYRPKQNTLASDTASTQAPLHGILLAITIFFLCGILISEALMRGKRAPAAVAAEEVLIDSAPDKPELTGAAAAPTAAKTTAKAEPMGAATATVVPAPVAVLPTATAPGTGTATITPPSTGAPEVASPLVVRAALPPRIDVLQDAPGAAPKSVTVAQRREPVAAQERTTERAPAGSERAAPPVDRQRCSSLIGKFSLGEELSAQDKRYLETSCR